MIHRFVVTADADPQSLPKIVGQLGRHWITPSMFAASRSGDIMRIDFTVDGLPAAAAELIEATLGSLVAVRSTEMLGDPTGQLRPTDQNGV